MRTAPTLITIALAVTLAAPSAPAAADPASDAGDRLGTLINDRLRADGPFFTPPERAVIERACGYAPGSWDGFEVNINNGALICTNGRRAEGPEIRAVLTAAEPRIEARVERMMASAEVREAIARVAEEAAAEAVRGVELAMAGLEDVDVEGDVNQAERLDVDVDRALDDDGDRD